MYVLVQWDYAQIFYSLSAWLEYVAEGGKELSKEAAQKRFGKLGRTVPQPIASEEEYRDKLANIETLKNAKEGTPSFCTLKVLSILVAGYKDTQV